MEVIMKKLRTTITALVTPFLKDKIDYESLEKLIRQQIKGGVGGFVINGTTAESPTLEWPEVESIFKFTRAIVGNNYPLIIGTGSNSTSKTVFDTKKAKELGADAALVVVPYYNKPPQRGLVAHFKAVAEQSNFPIILYNVPGRTITALSLDSIIELAKVPYIIGMKEASGNIEFAKEISLKCGPDFILLSGDDGTYIDFLKNGGHGVISVASHIIPEQFAAWLKNSEQADDFSKYKDLINALFIEANPIPVKKALQIMKIINSAELRLPLSEMDPLLSERLKLEMQKVGIINE
jgi:4-hydroxy-tetrahydrodipicolinate synthase